MKKAFLSIVSFIFFFHALYGQEQPLNSQYFLNPYLYNPAFAGYDNRPAVFLGSRQQWTGIEGAPRTTYLTFHTPIAKVIPFGINIYNDSRGILSTTYALMTAGFRARFDEDDHYLSFALSGGGAFNTVDYDNPLGDPLVDAGLNNYLAGNAGLLYHNQKFNFGVSLPKLFNHQSSNEKFLETSAFNPLTQAIGTINYRLVVSEETFVIDPWVSYYYFENLDGQFEGTLRFILKDFFWVGGSYRMNYGASGFFGINIKDNFRFGYAYEMGASSVSGFSNGSHEFQIGLIFGKSEKQKRSSTNFYQRRRQMLNTMRSNTQPQQTQQQNQSLYKVENDPFKKEEPKEEPKQETTPTTPVTPPQKDKEEVDLNAFMEGYEEIKEDTVKEEPVKRVRKPEPVQPKKEEEKSILSTFEAPKVDEVTTRDESGIYIGPTTVQKGDHLLELEEGYYVIVGTFNSYRDAEEFSDKLFIQGFYTKFGYISQTTDYYVYIFHSPDNKQECVDTIDRFKQITTVLSNMWVLTVE